MIRGGMMETFIYLFALLFAVYADAQATTLRGRCVAVIDGDTVEVVIDQHQLLRIRVAWIDAPEIGQAFGNAAKQAMARLVFGREVELRPHVWDRYGRLVAMVIVDHTDAGLELVKQGLAWAYWRYLPEASADIQDSYRTAHETAQANRLGLWQDASPMAPWNFRKLERQQRASLPMPPTVSSKLTKLTKCQAYVA